MPDLETQIVAAVGKRTYQPLKPKALAKKLGVPANQYGAFRKSLRDLLQQGRVVMGKNQTVRQAEPHGSVTGVFKKAAGGFGFVRPHRVDGQVGADVFIPESAVGDAATGDSVLARIRKKPNRPDANPTGEIVQVIERATRQFVGTYFEREGQGYVRVDGTVFSHSIWVGDPGAKGAKPDDKVVFEMIRFPTSNDRRGEGVITEILGPRGQPGVDTLSVIRGLGLPDAFPEDVLQDAREQAAAFHEDDLAGRKDFTEELVVTIDPVDARDFDDAISLVQDAKSKHWQLTVHIADVAHFAPTGSALDREARKRATSVYLPQRVLPMFPEIISNSLASLQQGKVRYVKSAVMDFTPGGALTSARFHNGAIRVRRRFTYEEVGAAYKAHDAGTKPAGIESEIFDLLLRMRELAMILRKRRMKRGALNLEMPEVELEYDEQGRVIGGHFVTHDISHQVIEEFMLSANEAVAEKLDSLGVPFLRRVHPAPEPQKLQAFAEFARMLSYKIGKEVDRFSLQKVLDQAAGKPEMHAINYALLRSLKQATYSPEEEGHFALASENYCHFTSPIRRYPDLTVHRQLDQYLRTGRAGGDRTELAALGEHCSKMERRAELAERELVKLKLLTYLSERIGMESEVIVTGVADYGFYAQAEKLPVEGLVHVSTLTDDYYYFEEASHSLIGKRTGRVYRLGDRVHVQVVRVDLQRRQLDFRVIQKGEKAPPVVENGRSRPAKPKSEKPRKGRGKGKRPWETQ